MIERVAFSALLRSFRRHPGNALVVSMQVIVAMVVICNALYIAVNRLSHVAQPSGLNESHLLSVVSGKAAAMPSIDERVSQIEGDLERIRSVPGTVSVTETFSMPLSGSTKGGGVAATYPSDENRPVSYFFADAAAIETLGLRIIAGHGFDPVDITAGDAVPDRSGPVILTDALATRLYGSANEAVGKRIYLNGRAASSTVVGVVERMEIPNVHPDDTLANWYTVLVPVRYTGDSVNYVSRTSSPDLEAYGAHVVKALVDADPTRIIDDEDVATFSRVRDQAFGPDMAMAKTMLGIVLVLVLVTAAGIYGLVSSWIRRRYRIIGIRRALGATTYDIIFHLQIENILIVGPAAIVGGVIALASSSWLMHFAVGGQLPIGYVVGGGLVVVLVAQAAVLLPAVLAARVPPAIVIRKS